MYDLIKTTYKRSFDKHIVYRYLHTNSEQKIKAALLSIAQSEDTSFVPELLKLDLMRYGGEVCFTLAQIGSCNQSINFLWNCLFSSPSPNQFPKIFFAIGKIGDETDLNKLVEFYNSFDGPIFPYEGISEAILQFQIRGIKSVDSEAILKNEVLHNLSTERRISQALFALIRYGGASDDLNDRLLYLIRTDLSTSSKEPKLYSLMNFSKKKVVPFTWDDVFSLIVGGTAYPLAFEIPKAVINFHPSKDELDIFHYYLNKVLDDNKNIAIQYARSLREMETDLVDSLPGYSKNGLIETIKKIRTSPTLLGEMLLTYYYYFNDYEAVFNLIKTENFKIPYRYIIKLFALDPDTEKAKTKLNEFYNYFYHMVTVELSEKLEALNQLLKLYKNSIVDSAFSTNLLASIGDKQAAIISTACDFVDTILIKNKKSELFKIVGEQIIKYKDNPDFLEATMSLINLAEKIDKDFYNQMIEKVKSSKLYSIRKFVSSKTVSRQIGFKELDKFEDIWVNAFKYKQATIKTSKGNVVIKFDSEIAPISIANFCMLAKQNFYNGIIFHRVVPGFVIQAGDPTATGWGGPGYDIVSEYSDTDFGIGYVGMASAGKDTESSQFFIMQGSYPHLDSRYSLFAKVITGMDIVYNITEEDKIISIEPE